MRRADSFHTMRFHGGVGRAVCAYAGSGGPDSGGAAGSAVSSWETDSDSIDTAWIMLPVSSHLSKRNRIAEYQLHRDDCFPARGRIIELF